MRLREGMSHEAKGTRSNGEGMRHEARGAGNSGDSHSCLMPSATCLLQQATRQEAQEKTATANPCLMPSATCLLPSAFCKK
jgi:hypothetical protein